MDAVHLLKADLSEIKSRFTRHSVCDPYSVALLTFESPSARCGFRETRQRQASGNEQSVLYSWVRQRIIAKYGFVRVDADLARGPMPWVALNGTHHGDYWLLKSNNFGFTLNKAATNFSGNIQTAINRPQFASMQSTLPTQEIVRLASSAVLLFEAQKVLVRVLYSRTLAWQSAPALSVCRAFPFVTAARLRRKLFKNFNLYGSFDWLIPDCLIPPYCVCSCYRPYRLALTKSAVEGR